MGCIGSQMRDRLKGVQKGYVQRVLFGGLVVVLERRGPVWRLALGRSKVPPSTGEVESVTKDFGGIPPGVEWNWTRRKNHKRQIWHVAECMWREGEG